MGPSNKELTGPAAESDNLTTEITLEEVKTAIKESATNKSPGLDGITAEFYQATVNDVAPELVEVFNDQLGRLSLVASNKHGATRLVSKVKGIPLVSELRPLTLLNVDYKILTKILAKRLISVLATVCRSPQSCTVPGSNICSSATSLPLLVFLNLILQGLLCPWIL